MMVTLVCLGFEGACEGAGGLDFALWRSDIKGPAAEGGGLGVENWMAAGLELREKALLGPDDVLGIGLLDI